MSSRAKAIAYWIIVVTLPTVVCVTFLGIEAWAHIKRLPIEPNFHRYVIWSGAIALVGGFGPQLAARAQALVGVAAEAWRLWRGKGGGNA